MTPVHLKVDVMKQTSDGTSRAAGVKLNHAEIQVQDSEELSSERTETFTKALLSGLLHRRELSIATCLRGGRWVAMGCQRRSTRCA